MNFLAHLALSGNLPEVMVGNFIGDYVKGNRYEKYRPLVQTGILLHRRIDFFTDAHPVFRQSSHTMKDVYGKYSGVVMDVVYDYLLAKHWALSGNPLALGEFVGFAHRVLLRNYFRLPGEVRSFLPFLINSRRMESYAHRWGVEKALVLMSKYTSLPNHSAQAMRVLDLHEELLLAQFKLFFPEVKGMAEEVLTQYRTAL